jgi:glutathione synthase/RimK-type ligase-like ATP-grasp enzyme
MHRTKLWVQYIPKDYEFRVHVVNGYAAKVSQKVFDENIGEPDGSIIWNYSRGWGMRYPRDEVYHLLDRVKAEAVKATNALGLTFGAVDLVVWLNEPYILEVNTAPGVKVQSTADVYGRGIAQIIRESFSTT